MMRTLVILLAVCPILASCAQDSPPPSDQMIRIGSHRLQMHREGKGAPTIVIDAGITDPLDKLRPLQARLAQVTQVITYNRAGYGQSEPGPLPRDGGREAQELKALLEKASVPGPYVLVGHSLGALTAKSANGTFLLAEGASHYLYLDAPGLVAENILSIVRAVHAETSGTRGTDANLRSRARP